MKKVLIVQSIFYIPIAEELLEGAINFLDKIKAIHEICNVPGALEIPGAIAMAEASSQHYDAYVALGCVIRGETYHFEVVANESARGLMELAIHKGLAIGNGILTVEDKEQAWERAKNTGRNVAYAALEMAAIRNSFNK